MSLVPASKAAAYLALLRAIESNRPQRERLFNDPYAKLFLPPSLKLVAWLSAFLPFNRFVSWFIDKRWPGALTSCVARTRLIDVMTINSIDDEGINQVMIFGAGYDCRAHRLQIDKRISFVEVDHPGNQQVKKDILAKASPVPTTLVDYVPVDFHTQRPEDIIPDLLQKTHYKTMFIWEGVTNYLTAPIADKIFQYFKTFRPGTIVVFTYVDEKVLKDPGMFFGASSITRLLQKNSEFWNFGIDPANIHNFLAAYNMKVIYDEGATAYRHKYFGKRAAKMKGYEYYRVAMAIVQ